MTWVKKRITVITKAYPEHSTKYGDVACTAGIDETGEWVRLYPIDIRHFIGPNKISKFHVIEVECQKDDDYQHRKESYKIRPDSIKIIDRTLSEPRPDWKRRSELLLTLRDKSIEDLQDQFKAEKKSIGLIRPSRLIDFIKTEELQSFEEASWSFTLTLYGEKIPTVTKIPHIFKYRFTCPGCDEGNHEMQCEDWELFESYRSWAKKYKSPDELWKKLHLKYYNTMTYERNLYFIMGTHSKYPTWFIIGIYYPPKLM
jgi:hypothetical protein